jgi:uncharacterized protein (TIGR02599 family)
MTNNHVRPAPRGARAPRGFTLVELLVSLAILGVLLTVIAQVLAQVQLVWTSASSRVSQFREARRAMDRVTHTLSQATLNTYLQYFYGGADPLVPPIAAVSAPPQGYVRFSELQFLSGPASAILSGGGANINGHAIFFQAPLGGGLPISANNFISLPTALSACGYYVEFNTDREFRPPFLNGRGIQERQRFRLMEYRPPIEANVIYDQSGNTTPGVPNPNWFQQVARWARPVAENIILLVISPKRPLADGAGGDPRDLAPNYVYNTSGSGVALNQMPQDFQLPPLVEVTMVALDENSARRLAETSGGAPQVAQGLFTNASDQQFRRDLETLETNLNNDRINYRIFSATVPIRASKWGL